MSYEQQITSRVGEQIVAYGEFSASSGTGTLQAGSLFYLYNKYGVVNPSFNGVGVTGYDIAAGVTGRVWYVLDLSSLTPDVYYGVFRFSVTGSDALVRNSKPDLQIVILPVIEVVATYDPQNVRGQVRKWLRDIDCGGLSPTYGTAIGLANPIWSDGEVDDMLLQAGYAKASTTVAATTDGTTVTNTTTFDVLLAAAIGWELAAADAAKTAVIEKIAIFSDNTVSTYESILKEAKRIRQLAGYESPGVATTPDSFYQLTASTSNPSATYVIGDASLQSW